MNNLNQDTDNKTRQPDIIKDLNIEPSAPPEKDVYSDDDDNKLYYDMTPPPPYSSLQFTNISPPQPSTNTAEPCSEKKPSLPYDTKAPGVMVEIKDLKEKERKRRNVRRAKKTFGILGWVLCSPLMVCGLCIRDKPDVNDDEEWKDDMCLPCYYDVDYRYPHER